MLYSLYLSSSPSSQCLARVRSSSLPAASSLIIEGSLISLLWYHNPSYPVQVFTGGRGRSTVFAQATTLIIAYNVFNRMPPVRLITQSFSHFSSSSGRGRPGARSEGSLAVPDAHRHGTVLAECRVGPVTCGPAGPWEVQPFAGPLKPGAALLRLSHSDVSRRAITCQVAKLAKQSRFNGFKFR